MTTSKQNSQLWRFDFTLSCAVGWDHTRIIKQLDLYCKQWVLQQEEGESGYLHYQGRVSLKDKTRMSALIKLGILSDKTHWSITSNKAKGFDYVMKEDTRIMGPWMDTDKPRYIPRQYRGKMETLRPFQKHILESAYHFDERIINVIVSPDGNIGKSVVASLGELYSKGIDLPPCNDAEKLIQSCCNICMAKKIRNPSPIFIDLPRSFNQEKMNGIFTAIEQIKKGKLYDMRYNYTEWWIDSPQIWVFTNNEDLELDYLSRDRWKIWTVNTRYELEKFKRPSAGYHRHSRVTVDDTYSI